MRRAEVYCNDIKAGILEEETPGRNYTFTYDAKYLADNIHEPISLTMPLREEAYCAPVLFSCFTNMLPEGTNRKVVCRNWRIDEKDYFGLLLKIATVDTIGNVTVKEIV